MYNDFTKDHIETFKLCKYNLDSDNVLLNSIKKERRLIQQFIIDNPVLNIDIKKINSIGNIKEYCEVDWVATKDVELDLINIPDNYEIKWSTLKNKSKKNTIKIKTTSEQFESFKQRLKVLIYMIEYIKFKTNNIIKELDIYLILTILKKMIPESNKKIGIINVNTGYTDFSNNIIFIWRYEEFEKVLFHELIHYFNMDSRHTHLNHKIDIEGPHSYYEAITDFWGVYYHLIYFSIITNIKIKSLLELELGFICNQAMILHNFFELEDWKIKPNKIISQKTPAFSYYIIKYLLFEYFLINDLNEISDYNLLLDNILRKGFFNKPYIKIKSFRMTLLQLK
jgi:hypothetical protein